MGLMVGPASTDAVNRASQLSYGEATGITQTVRNYAASLGLAILGTILVARLRSRIVTSLLAQGVPNARAHAEASSISQSQSGSGSLSAIPHFVRIDFAYATRSVLYVMAAMMAAAALAAFIGLRAGCRRRRRRPTLTLETFCLLLVELASVADELEQQLQLLARIATIEPL